MEVLSETLKKEISVSLMKVQCMKKTQTVCPECYKVIEGTIYEEDGQVLIKKTCPDHGEFKDIYWSDANLYHKAQEFYWEGYGVTPCLNANDGCPNDCGLCCNHKTNTCLALMELTNRCNLKCPVCFANAGKTGYVIEPSMDEIESMMVGLREQKPVPVQGIQFTGGEPLLRREVPDIVQMATDLGFSALQMSSNGLVFDKNPELAHELHECGLGTIYYQFDGLKRENYIKMRGEDLLDKKLHVIEVCREAQIGVLLVPTLIKGVNDDQIGPMFEFGRKNRDIIRGINVQPVSFAGRITFEDRKNQRITTPDVMKAFEQQTNGVIKPEHWITIPAASRISTLSGLFKGESQVQFTMEPSCGVSSYVYLGDDEVNPFANFMDAEKFFKMVEDLTNAMKNKSGIGKVFAKIKAFWRMRKLIDKKKAPKGIDAWNLMKSIMTTGKFNSLRDFHLNTFFLGCMHFMDAYNYDLARVSRCGIHYIVPDYDGSSYPKILPFCAYNNIPKYREKVVEAFKVPIDEWKEHRKDWIEQREDWIKSKSWIKDQEKWLKGWSYLRKIKQKSVSDEEIKEKVAA